MRLLLVNPNVTQAITDTMMAESCRVASPGTEFTAVAHAANELGMTARYGDVRRFDPAPLVPLIEGLFVQGALALLSAANCDNDAANLNALTQLVEQLEDVNKEVGITGLRWNVNLLGTGVGWITTNALDRLQVLGCSIQLSSNNWVNSNNPNVVAGHAYRTINQHPIHKSLFSNATHISPLNPWLHTYYVVTGVNSFGQQVNPDEHLTREEALSLRTSESSWHLQMEDRLGTIEPGKLADLAVLSQDILAVPADKIRETKALLTLVGGRIVHRNGI